MNPKSLSHNREALEQSTHPRIARYHASRFPAGVEVLDGTAGMGVDAIAFAERGSVVAVENDPVKFEFTRQNVPGKALLANITEYLAEHSPEYLWLDPGRRTDQGRRITKLSEYQPSPLELRESLQNARLSGVKCSPITSDEELESIGRRVEFVSYDRECREAVCWNGRSEIEEGFFAVLLTETEEHVLPRRELEEFVDFPSEYLVEADPAAIRAHCLGNFGLPGIGDSNGYLSSWEKVESPWLRNYKVHHVGSADIKRTRAVLREKGFRVFEVKQKGANLEPTKVMRELKTDGDPVSLIAYRVGKSVKFILASAA
jgi:hypothetical protein